jgi:hypothetical protein
MSYSARWSAETGSEVCDKEVKFREPEAEWGIMRGTLSEINTITESSLMINITGKLPKISTCFHITSALTFIFYTSGINVSG